MDFDPKKIKLIIGLGNPDTEHKNTYHNAGFLFIDYSEESPLVKSFPPKEDRPTVEKFKVIKSEEYMNNSGKFVVKAAKKAGAKPEEILIAHADSDLEIGKYKIDFGRGAGGHHGIESVQQHLKTNDFWRLRIGIRPANETTRQKAEEFVLKKISSNDKKILGSVFEEIILRLNKPQH